MRSFFGFAIVAALIGTAFSNAVASEGVQQTAATKPAVPATERELEQRVAEAKERVATATAIAVAQIEASPEYVAAMAELKVREKALETARRLGGAEAAFDASAAFNKTKATIARLKEKAITDKARLEAVEAWAGAQLALRKVVVAREEREKLIAAEAQAKREADPVYQAMQNHTLVRGMTIDEAIRSLRCKPYSVTDAGNVVSATWRVEDGSYWGATFVDGKASVVSHSRY